ncbi:mRNA cleavage and polyadenlylation factor subunit [Komagataella phaffii CBS 7435]|uniref:Cleavage and polyadenylation specificity factor subunit 2 n=2 Tax=Komagataella phaffii TaxID=460519 RepID=C4QZW3_KOMPG|nr:uncharacterized protein PAS_chr2-1_0816 [Komagataella phaffii GS115]AOA62005.1 GQ67_00207T0 [Komagataella phaffii]CAH2448714.1 mRNA cleavage and polyadenlylation factor subunit [Komagataella phaffii CBS 7435]AOA67533.1 GQ68_01181T0 [Komagataella phaffii GS115]CAY68787.1 hypothetical protein PAS_chr2-1_0816 [Komagataella phaffii GS115]CCA38805.1 mRNA cleavage and polyadenlylation factor subunit [Komagataella phaffii CBS 7435]
MFSYTLLSPDNENTVIRASLLYFDPGINIFADPSWDGVADLSYLDKIIPQINVILLSHPTADFIGGFVYLLQKYPVLKTLPIYSTYPITNLGKVSTTELYRAKGLVGPLEGSIMEKSDIDECFDSIIPLKYSQSTPLTGIAQGLSVTPYNAGHSLGGTFWSINYNNEKIVYAPAWNHSKDSFLNSATFLQSNGHPIPQLVKPASVITGSDLGSSLSYNKKLEKFFTLVDATIAQNGTVFLPTSMSGRFLELLHLMDQHLGNQPIPVLLVAFTGSKSLSLAGNMLEWMSPKIIKDWEERNETPFDPSRVQLVDVDDLVQLPGAKVVFTADADLTIGSTAHSTLASICIDEKNTIIFTERPTNSSFGASIYEIWEKLTLERNGKLEDGFPVPFEKLLTFSRVTLKKLTGLELAQYTEIVNERKQEKRKKRQVEKMNTTILADKSIDINKPISEFDPAAVKALEEDEDEDEEEDKEDIGVEETANDERGNTTTTAVASTKKQEKDIYKIPLDFDVRNAKGRNRLFPYHSRIQETDDYGIKIDHSDFVKEDKSEEFSRMLDNKLKRNNRGKGNGHMGDDDDDDDDDDNDDGGENGPARKRRRNAKSVKETIYNFDPLVNPERLQLTSNMITARCGLSFIDLSGTVDLRSVLLILNSLKPRNLLILPGRKSHREKTAESIVTSIKSKNSRNTQVYVTIPDEAIEMESAQATLEVKLADTLESELQWQNIAGGYSVAYVNGVLETITDKKIESQTTENEDEGDKNKDESHYQELVLNPLDQLSTLKSTAPLAIGDIRLSDLKTRLLGLQLKAEFKGKGTLVINDEIMIKKLNDGEIMIDGTCNELFYVIRSAVQGMLAYV